MEEKEEAKSQEQVERSERVTSLDAFYGGSSLVTLYDMVLLITGCITTVA